MFYIDTNNRKAIPLEKKSFSELKLSERYDLQEWVVNNPQILGENLLVIQKEFDGFSDTNERLDLLALDESGKLVVIENKLDDSGKDVVWQALKYVSYCATLTKSEICEIYQRYLGTTGVATDKLCEYYGTEDYTEIKLNHEDGEQRIMLVAANFRREVTSTVLWLRNYHNVDITCIKVTPYKDGEKLYLDTEQIIPIKDAQDYQIRLTAKKQEETISSKEEALRHKLALRFWEHALPVLRERTGMYHNVSPTKYWYVSGASGHSGIVYNAVVNVKKARAELFIRIGDNVDETKRIYNALLASKSQIESTNPKTIDWQWNDNPKTCNISMKLEQYGSEDEQHWDEIIEFLADGVSGMKRVFQPLLDEVVKA